MTAPTLHFIRRSELMASYEAWRKEWNEMDRRCDTDGMKRAARMMGQLALALIEAPMDGEGNPCS